jgi:Zn-dependent peptidase ImmA (M78 family)
MVKRSGGMMPNRRTADSPPFNPAVLRWARDYAGLSLEEAADKLKIPADRIADWEDRSGKYTPTVRQARDLADTYGRSFLELFLPAPPDVPRPELIPDYRLYRDAGDPAEKRELQNIQMWAQAQRENALDLFEEVGDEPPAIPDKFFCRTSVDPEDAAKDARVEIEFPIADQVGTDNVPGVLRDRIEQFGILTLRPSEMKRYRARGFCIAAFPLPIMAFANESPQAQAFTLGHELAHVKIRASAISGLMTRTGGRREARDVEEWCNRFSSAFLMPRDVVAERLAPPAAPRAQLSDDEIATVADFFGVSKHAALIRLVHLRYVQPEYYWDVKKPQYDEEERNFRVFGRPKYYGRRFENSQGNLYTSLVLEALNTGRITNHNAAEYMGIKNLAHMRDIRENFGM